MRTDTSEFAALLALALTPANRRLLEMRLLDGFGAAQYQQIFALLDLVLDRDSAPAERISATGTDRLYLEALVALVAGGTAAARIEEIGEDYDFFHCIRDEHEWSLLRCVNFMVRAQIRGQHKSAIVTSIRNEGVNILEWIAHHRALGVDGFIIYANDNDDGSCALLRCLAEQDMIHLVWNTTALGRDGGDMFPIQAKAYGHACEFLNASLDYEFLYFTDMDEFLLTQALDQPQPLDDLFGRMAEIQEAAAVAFNWKIFTSQCVFRRRAGLNFERFQHIAEADHVKTIVRRGRCLSFSTSHLPRLPAGDVVLDGGLKPAAAAFKMKPVYDYGQVNHYWHKSFEEFIAKHLRVRGDARFESFLITGEQRKGPREVVPEAWIARVKAEMKMLAALPGVAEALAEIEVNFRRLLREFDEEVDSETLFYRCFVRVV